MFAGYMFVNLFNKIKNKKDEKKFLNMRDLWNKLLNNYISKLKSKMKVSPT